MSAKTKKKRKMPKHWLHAAYDRGRQDAIDGEDHCPYVGLEKDWWEYGWQQGALERG